MLTSTDKSYERQLIRGQAIRYLSFREHAFDELRRKLLQKFEPEKVINEVLQELTLEGLMSERRYAEAYIRARVNKGCGPVRISADLRHKELPSSLIDSALDQSGVDWDQEIQKVWSKKYGRCSREKLTITEKMNQSRFLQYRGFPHAQIKHFFEK